ncbi:MAG TPA: MBOAT family O-acyltransferase [Dongiaceae bacterium]|nr:MBOAT family O-acyltransferase [Dongiaceae bacterium]
MLFNSAAFLFAFLPPTLLGFIALAYYGHVRLAGMWVTAASLIFYGWWNPIYVPLLLGSILFNYLTGGYLLRRPSRVVLAVGIAANVLLLLYYKYTGFLVGASDQLFGLEWQIPNIILPLAISFFTFQQIAYLVDAYGGAVMEHDFFNYCLFITFFPHLIAGPITHHREMLPQFSNPTIFRPTFGNLGLGSTLFLAGLFKKIIIADTMGTYARPIFAAAATGEPASFLGAWGGVLSYALQLYFDFSGYTDMAIGLGLLFGISLPPNFDSPYKSRSVIEFWSRWHMTLTRFLTAYIYNPIVAGAIRRRIERGLPIPKRGHVPLSAFVGLVALPTIFTMFLAGAWHGAGWQFIIFGLLHGAYLTVNQAWRQLKIRWGRPLESRHPLVAGASVLTTLLCVIVGEIFFRAADVPTALNLLSGMVGAHGIALPARVSDLPGIALIREYFGLPILTTGEISPVQVLLIIGLFATVWLLPNTQQLLREFRTVLAPRPRASWLQATIPVLIWRPGAIMGFIVGWLGFFLIIRAISAAPTEFLYFQF